MKLLRCLTLTALVAAAGACGTEPGPVRVDMALDKVVVAMDDSVRVSLTLTNVSTRPVRVQSTYGMCQGNAFEVRDVRGRELAHYVFCILALVYAPQHVELGPGASLSVIDWWRPALARHMDGSMPTPGPFQLRGRAFTDDGVVRTAATMVQLSP